MNLNCRTRRGWRGTHAPGAAAAVLFALGGGLMIRPDTAPDAAHAEAAVEGKRESALRLPVTQSKEEPRIHTRLLGGRGALNVPCRSLDSRAFAFVSYRLIQREESK